MHYRDQPASRGGPGARSPRHRPGLHRLRLRPRIREQNDQLGIDPLQILQLGETIAIGRILHGWGDTSIGGRLDRSPNADNNTADKYGPPPPVPVREPADEREGCNAAQLSELVSIVLWDMPVIDYTHIVDNENETSGRPFPIHAERRLILLHVVDGTPIAWLSARAKYMTIYNAI